MKKILETIAGIFVLLFIVPILIVAKILMLLIVLLVPLSPFILIGFIAWLWAK
jgi:hypothetical protein